MKTHDLARLLLQLDNHPVATHANGHTYSSEKDKESHGPLQIALAGNEIVVGNMLDYCIRTHSLNGKLLYSGR